MCRRWVSDSFILVQVYNKKLKMKRKTGLIPPLLLQKALIHSFCSPTEKRIIFEGFFLFHDSLFRKLYYP